MTRAEISKDRRERAPQFKARERLIGDGVYEMFSSSSKPFRHGAAGLVYKATYKGALTRAVKFLVPEEATDAVSFRKTFDSEIKLLASVNHTNLAKIVDFGRATIGGREFQYYATDFIEGDDLADYWTAPECTGAQFLDLIGQILAAVDYLHAGPLDPGEAIMHSDLKPDNIRVRKAGHLPPTAVVLDLGVAKVISGGQRPLLIGRGGTTFHATEKYTRDEYRGRLNKQLTEDELVEMFPDHDLYAIGLIIKEALKHEPLKALVGDELRDSRLTSINLIVEELLGRASDRRYFRTAAELASAWKRIRREYLSPVGIPELSLAASAKSSVPLPTGRVNLTERIQEVVNHPSFQRLRLLPQLELIHLVYPGGRHTRLLHSLTTFEVARQFVAHLLNDVDFRLQAEPAEIEAGLLWSLLHDVGHFPLSHMFEDFARGRSDIADDEQLFWGIVDPEYASSLDIPLARNVDVASHLAGPPDAGLTELLRHHFPHALDALKTINTPAGTGASQRRRPSAQMIAGLLSAPIDVDKIAYLLDDSLMTGVRFGLGIDLDGLLAAVRPPAVAADGPAGDRIRHQGAGGGRVGGGQSAVDAEQGLLAPAQPGHPGSGEVCCSHVAEVRPLGVRGVLSALLVLVGCPGDGLSQRPDGPAGSGSGCRAEPNGGQEPHCRPDPGAAGSV